MVSLEEKGRAVIDITNACVHQCSNCTRFCGHYKNTYFMDEETFKRAVDSTEGLNRVFIIGGEPTLHPKFKEFLKYAAEKVQVIPHPLKTGLKPAAHFVSYREQCTAFGKYALNDREGLTLLTCLPSNYYEAFEDIHDCIDYQMINDHNKPSRHQPILISRRELGVQDEEWIKMRDACWAQELWCPAITPKGCFFCEVAAALDMLFDGPGGWPIEKDWWKRKPEEWRDQLEWCEYCAMPIFSQGRDSDEEIDDISPAMLEKLQSCGNFKLKKKEYKTVKIDEEGNAELNCKEMYNQDSNRYLTNYSDRFSAEQSKISPRKLTAVICSESVPYIKEMAGLFQDAVAFIKEEAVRSMLSEEDNKSLRVYPWGGGTLGQAVNKAVSQTKDSDWFILLQDGDRPLPNLKENLLQCILNPGVLHLDGNSLIFNRRAKALINEGLDRIAGIEDAEQFKRLWEPAKIYELYPGFERAINPDFKEWIALTDSLSGREREKCKEKLNYIRSLILTEYYTSYIFGREISFRDKLVRLEADDCMEQLEIEEITEDLLKQMKGAFQKILEKEGLSERVLKEAVFQSEVFRQLTVQWDAL